MWSTILLCWLGILFAFGWLVLLFVLGYLVGKLFTYIWKGARKHSNLLSPIRYAPIRPGPPLDPTDPYLNDPKVRQLNES